MAKKDPKQELLSLLDEVVAMRKKINDLESKRRKAVEELDSELSKAYMDLDTLCEKKRIIENAMLDEMVYS